ncbi:hypothetical protein BCV70DRAFT_202982 [Testicularia cyperi]|uniref:alpha-1,2-Mannosidase n=1 Tax=Testicularia cyperi TaxID=1882483 RepID=A0A317XFX4_9BASI|nr:hypothetical protein BCV70DRAFT_202982 [Testicularia cyperi]
MADVNVKHRRLGKKPSSSTLNSSTDSKASTSSASTSSSKSAKLKKTTTKPKSGSASVPVESSNSSFVPRLVIALLLAFTILSYGPPLIQRWLTPDSLSQQPHQRGRPRPPQQQASSSSSDREPWGKNQRYFSSKDREPSLPFTLPPTRPLPDNPVRGVDNEKQAAILEAFTHSWSAYRRDAWGYDEYHPIGKVGSNLNGQPGNGIGYTIVDTLDTLILMGFVDEYEAARDWVRDELSWDVPGRMNVFETTIRTLGGLLSAAALIREPPHPAFQPSEEDAQMFISRATELANRLLPAFDTPSGVPLREVDLETGEAFPDISNNNSSSLAEATTVQLELKYLAHLTGNSTFWRVAERPMKVVRDADTYLHRMQGLLPIFLNPMTGMFYNGDIRLGSRGDSYYEYLIKQWLQTGRTEQVYRDMYDYAIKAIKRILTKPSIHSNPPLFFTTELSPRRAPDGQMYMQLVPKQDHLVCFLGGSMMLGATSMVDIWGDASKRPIPPISDVGVGDATDREDWRLGHEFVRTCMDTYSKTKTGLSPEIAFFKTPQDVNMTREMYLARNVAPIPPNVDWYIKKPPPSYKGMANPLIDARNILRPETVESLFVAFHLTGDPIYRDWGWQIFQAFDKHCRVPGGGYSSIDDVDSSHPQQLDRMETFWLSETLKYLYLLFSDQNLLPLSKWVLNTEAHPLPVFVPNFSTGVK